MANMNLSEDRMKSVHKSHDENVQLSMSTPIKSNDENVQKTDVQDENVQDENVQKVRPDQKVRHERKLVMKESSS